MFREGTQHPTSDGKEIYGNKTSKKIKENLFQNKEDLKNILLEGDLFQPKNNGVVICHALKEASKLKGNSVR